MILKIGTAGNEVVWHLHFHTQEAESDEERAKRDLPPLLWDLETICAIHTGLCIWSQKTPKYCINGVYGKAYCSKKDHFVKAVAGKIALARALKHSSLSKETRRAIWDAYWLRVRRPKEKPEKFRKRLATGQKAA